MAFDAVSKMESKKYEEKREVETVKTMKEKLWERTLETHSHSAMGISCVICLEEFKQGQVIYLLRLNESWIALPPDSGFFLAAAKGCKMQ